jgi:hypothetical protein
MHLDLIQRLKSLLQKLNKIIDELVMKFSVTVEKGVFKILFFILGSIAKKAG